MQGCLLLIETKGMSFTGVLDTTTTSPITSASPSLSLQSSPI